METQDARKPDGGAQKRREVFQIGLNLQEGTQSAVHVREFALSADFTLLNSMTVLQAPALSISYSSRDSEK